MTKLSDLPAELKLQVLSYLPITDLKNVRYLNSVWDDVAASILFRFFKTNLCPTNNRDLLAITHAESGILKHVKQLDILRPRGEYARDTLSLFLVALQKDVLTSFSSNDPIECHVFEILLKRQTQLRRLYGALVKDGKPCAPPNGAWVKDSVSKLEDLHIAVSGHEDAYRSWFQHMPSLKCVYLNGCRQQIFRGWEMPTSAPRLELDELILWNIGLPDAPGPALDWLASESLQSLTILGCPNSRAFMLKLAHHFYTNGASLKSLKYSDQWHVGRMVHIEKFLRSFFGLTHLRIVCAQGAPLDPVVLANHGDSLRSLHLDHYVEFNSENFLEPGLLYSMAGLQALLDGCPNIEQLGINLLNVYFRNWWDLEPFHIFPHAKRARCGQAIAAFLKVLAKSSKIHTLRLTRVPPLCAHRQYNGDPQMKNQIHQHLIQQYADEVMGFLADQGSRIQNLAIYPLPYKRRPRTASDPDGNQLLCHKYFYRRGSLSVSYGMRETVRALAVPINESELGDLDPCPFPLFDF